MSLSLDLHDYCKLKEFVRVSKQVFSKNRKNINSEAFKVLNFKYLKRIYDNTKYTTFMGYVLLAVDGCNMNRVIICVKALSSEIYDCLNNMMIDFKIVPYKTRRKNSQ
ncbi:MAG: hypothetical protein LBT10_09685 [Methanobrevibacter sp.]|nr:hypothetical protein [Methanobrevibacter sp.]